MIKSLRARYDSARIRWQGFMTSTIGGFPVEVHPEDRRFWIDANFGAWEPETLETYRQFVRPDMEVCDIGAWVGPTAIFAAKLGASVTCFEPDPAAYERLLFNLRRNAAGRVRPFPMALGGEDGLRRMGAMASHLGQSGTSFHAPERGSQSTDVLALSWSSAVRLLRLPRFDFIKIDVEGGESELLPAMLPYLREHRPTLLLSTHFQFIPEELHGGLFAALNELSEIYPGARKPDRKELVAGFPSLMFVGGES
jgi:FkbM family methyltransferase